MVHEVLMLTTMALMSIGSSHATDMRIVSNTESSDFSNWHCFQLDVVGEFKTRNDANANAPITRTNATNLTEQGFPNYPYQKKRLISYEENRTKYSKENANEEDEKHEYEDCEHHNDGEHEEDKLDDEEEDEEEDEDWSMDDEEDDDGEEEDEDEEWWLDDEEDEDEEEEDEDEEWWLDDEEDEDEDEDDGDEDEEWWLDDEDGEEEDDGDDEEWYDNIDSVKYLSGNEMLNKFGISIYHILWEQNNCDEVFAQEQSIPQDSTFELLQEIYVLIVGADKSSLIDGSGSHVATEVRQSEVKGRGVYATEPIKKGTLCWTNRKSATFSKGSDYRKYIEAIPEDMKCNTLIWTYVQSYGADKDSLDDTMLVTEFDNSCMVNSIGWIDEDQFNEQLGKGGIPNIKCVLDPSEKETGMACYSSIDIKAGDEILADYNDWNFPNGWSLFNLYD